MLRRTALASSLLLVGALVLTSCTGTSDTPGSTGAPDPDATLTVRLSLEPTNLDIRRTSGAALEQALIDNVYQGLVTRDASGGENEIVPALAGDYEVSTDGLTYTFTLREGVTFHDGSDLTADDVVSSLQTAKDDDTIQNSADLANVSSISAPDATTVVITLAQPNIDFLFTLTGRAGLVFNEGDTTDLSTAANGTGPFRVQSWNTGDSLVLKRNDDYWGEAAGVQEVVLDYIPDQSAAVNAAVNGDVDVALEIDPELQGQLEGGNFDIRTGLTTDKGTLAFNNQRAPLNDERVREALRLAIDHDALIETLGTGETLSGPIPPLDPGYEDLSGTVPYDPDRSRELLAEAGADDITLTLTIPNVYDSTLPTFLVSSFADVGVQLEVDSVEFPTWLTDVYQNKDYDLSFVRHVEARDFGNWANPDYYFGYDNAEVQDLYAQALATTDQEQSSDLLAEAARIVADQDAADWLFLATPIAAVGTHVSGFPENSLNVRLPLAGATVSAE